MLFFYFLFNKESLKKYITDSSNIKQLFLTLIIIIFFFIEQQIIDPEE